MHTLTFVVVLAVVGISSPATACVGTAGWPKEDVYNKQFFFFNVYLNF